MEKFATKQELLKAYAAYLVVEIDNRDECDIEIGEGVARQRAVYVPHIYRGGWVIRGFGFSTERIGTYIPADIAGQPEMV